MDERPCHLEAPHGCHEWTPMVVDPHHDHIFFLFPEIPLTCPGAPACPDHLTNGANDRA